MRSNTRFEERSAFERLVVPGAHGTGASITYQPGLDGLRGLAVGVVVLFHLGIGAVGGGFLAVSLFFTLSGVLIGTLMLAELDSTGRFDLRRFWVRRARRLLPAALAVLAVLSVTRLLTDTLSGTSGGDITAAALDVANWHFLATGMSYAELSTGPSAVLHFWSLAIEEQFYIVIAVVAVVVARRSTRPVRTMGLTAAVAAAASFLLPAAAAAFGRPMGIDRVYYGTDTRAGELMVGVVIAAVLVGASRRRRLLVHGRLAATLGLAGLLATVALWALATPGSATLRQGLLPLTALCSSLLVIGAMVPSGPVAAVARLGALRRLGRISYGVYLIHWPVIVIADQLTADRSLRRDLAIVVVTLGLAQLSATILELPVRRNRLPLRQLGAAAMVAVVVIAATTSLGGRRTASAELLADLQRHDPGDAAPSAIADRPDAALPRLALFGDSVAFSLLLALDSSPVPQHFVRAPSDVRIGCGIALSPSAPPDQPHSCDDPAERYALKAIAGHVDVAVMMSCQWELVAQTLPGDDHPRSIGDPVFDDAVRTRYLDAVDRLLAAGVSRVLWIECPYMSRTVGTAGLSPTLRDSRRPERMDRLDAIIGEVAADRAAVEVVPFGDWVNRRVDDAALRPDGSHFEFRSNTTAADQFIAMLDAALA